MKKAMAILFVCAAVALNADPVEKKANNLVLIEDLGRIEQLYFKYLSEEEQKEAVRLMNTIRTMIVQNEDLYDKPVRERDNNVMSDETVQALIDDIKDRLSWEKSSRILAIGKNGLIKCSQLARLVALFSFDSHKEELIKELADNIADPVNIGLVIIEIDSSIIQRELDAFFKDR